MVRHLANVGVPDAAMEMREVQATAGKLDLDVATLEIRRAEEITPAFESFRIRPEALFVVGDPLTLTNRAQINTLAQGARLPTIYSIREFVIAGGLMSYGPNFPDLFRRAADYVDKILRGTKPADLPVEQPHQIRSRHQSDDRESTSPRSTPNAARPRRRGHRVMRRREFITLLGGAVAWPVAGRAQEGAKPVGQNFGQRIIFRVYGPPDCVRQGLKETGFEGAIAARRPSLRAQSCRNVDK